MTLAAALGAAAVTPRAPVQPFSLPNRDANPAGRDQEVQKKRETFTYGPGPDQSVTVFPGGTLGQSIVQKQVLDLDAEEERHEKDVARDAQAVLIKMKKVSQRYSNSLQELDLNMGTDTANYSLEDLNP